MEIRQSIVFSLILVPIRSGLRGFRLFIFKIVLRTIGKRNRSNTMPCLSLQVMNKVHFRLVGFAEAKRYPDITSGYKSGFTTSALYKCILMHS
jgi:hypothetical protein